MWSGIRRLIAAMIMIMALAILGLFVDAAFIPVYDVLYVDTAVADSPFASVIEPLPGLAYFIIGLLIIGVLAWVVIGPIQETRLEQEQRRIR